MCQSAKMVSAQSGDVFVVSRFMRRWCQLSHKPMAAKNTMLATSRRSLTLAILHDAFPFRSEHTRWLHRASRCASSAPTAWS
jgi:hypothetical protein